MLLNYVRYQDIVMGRLPMWDRGHGFVGTNGSGSILHVDQAWWSNVAKNFLGHKLVALWGPGEAEPVLDACGGSLFRKPLSPEQHDALKQASRIAAYCMPSSYV